MLFSSNKSHSRDDAPRTSNPAFRRCRLSDAPMNPLCPRTTVNALESCFTYEYSRAVPFEPVPALEEPLVSFGNKPIIIAGVACVGEKFLPLLHMHVCQR